MHLIVSGEEDGSARGHLQAGHMSSSIQISISPACCLASAAADGEDPRKPPRESIKICFCAAIILPAAIRYKKDCAVLALICSTLLASTGRGGRGRHLPQAAACSSDAGDGQGAGVVQGLGGMFRQR